MVRRRNLLIAMTLACGLGMGLLTGCGGSSSSTSAGPGRTGTTAAAGASASSSAPASSGTGAASPTSVVEAASATGTTGQAGGMRGGLSAVSDSLVSDPLAGSGTLRPGASGPAVLALQRRLTELGYWLGQPDGHYGGLTQQAVIALQKVAGVPRDGVFGARTRVALQRGVLPTAHSRSGQVIEVDKQHQVMLMVSNGRVNRVVSVSTGSGAYYTAPNGHRGHAVTPAGHYTVFRAVDGWDTSPLGHLYRPRYFNGGIAVHGYPSVPSVPASHGCVRVSLPAMDMIWAQKLMPAGGSVWVY